jgi:hypothetical protein
MAKKLNKKQVIAIRKQVSICLDLIESAMDQASWKDVEEVYDRLTALEEMLYGEVDTDNSD